MFSEKHTFCCQLPLANILLSPINNIPPNNSFDKDACINRYGTIDTSTCIEVANKVLGVSNTVESAQRDQIWPRAIWPHQASATLTGVARLRNFLD